MIFRLINDGCLSREEPHPWAERTGEGWKVEIECLEDLATLAGAGGHLRIWGFPYDPTITIEAEA